jgi:hypothetical protein
MVFQLFFSYRTSPDARGASVLFCSVHCTGGGVQTEMSSRLGPKKSRRAGRNTPGSHPDAPGSQESGADANILPLFMTPRLRWPSATAALRNSRSAAIQSDSDMDFDPFCCYLCYLRRCGHDHVKPQNSSGEHITCPGCLTLAAFVIQCYNNGCWQVPSTFPTKDMYGEEIHP